MAKLSRKCSLSFLFLYQYLFEIVIHTQENIVLQIIQPIKSFLICLKVIYTDYLQLLLWMWGESRIIR